jgi:hypothetical protein
VGAVAAQQAAIWLARTAAVTAVTVGAEKLIEKAANKFFSDKDESSSSDKQSGQNSPAAQESTRNNTNETSIGGSGTTIAKEVHTQNTVNNTNDNSATNINIDNRVIDNRVTVVHNYGTSDQTSGSKAKDSGENAVIVVSDPPPPNQKKSESILLQGVEATADNLPKNAPVAAISNQTHTGKIYSNDPKQTEKICKDMAAIKGIDKIETNEGIYTVVRGDSLSKIAKNNNMSLKELREANPWVESRFSKDGKFALIHPNEKLVIPGKENLEKTAQKDSAVKENTDIAKENRQGNDIKAEQGSAKEEKSSLCECVQKDLGMKDKDFDKGVKESTEEVKKYTEENKQESTKENTQTQEKEIVTQRV